MPDFKYVFGPVPSRRLGRSLGVDLVPFKTCTYDCIYCQLGRTTTRTVTRRPYVPLDDVLSEIDRKLHSEALPDYTAARKRENFLKPGPGRLWIKEHVMSVL